MKKILAYSFLANFIHASLYGMSGDFYEPTSLGYLKAQHDLGDPIFIEHPIKADGDCGFHGLGLRREEAGEKLIDAIRDPESTIKELLLPDLLEAFRGGDWPLSLREGDQYKQLRAIYPMGEGSLENEDLRNYLSHPQIQEAFVRDYISKGGWLSYVPEQTGMLDALAQLTNLKVHVWTQAEENRRQLILVHRANLASSQSVHLIHRDSLTHFNLLEVKEREDHLSLRQGGILAARNQANVENSHVTSMHVGDVIGYSLEQIKDIYETRRQHVEGLKEFFTCLSSNRYASSHIGQVKELTERFASLAEEEKSILEEIYNEADRQSIILEDERLTALEEEGFKPRRLEEVIALRPYFRKKALEIKLENLAGLERCAQHYEALFHTYEGAIRVEVGDYHPGIEQVLMRFSAIKKLEAVLTPGRELEKGAFSKLLERPSQFYTQLEGIYLQNLGLQEEEILEYLHPDVIGNLQTIKEVDVRGNIITRKSLLEIRKRIPALNTLSIDPIKSKSLIFLPSDKHKKYLGDLLTSQQAKLFFDFLSREDKKNEAAGILGAMYLYGQGVEKNEIKGEELLLQGARQGDIQALYHLGKFYWIKGDRQKSLSFLRDAARGGYPEAQIWLFEVYLKGLEGITKNPQEALEYLQAAVKQRNAMAQFTLAQLYRNGHEEMGIIRNLEKAVHFFTLAVDQGYLPAFSQLGLMHWRGQGTRRDKERAKHLFKVAADAGDIHGMLGMTMWDDSASEDDQLEEVAEDKDPSDERRGGAGSSNDSF